MYLPPWVLGGALPKPLFLYGLQKESKQDSAGGGSLSLPKCSCLRRHGCRQRLHRCTRNRQTRQHGMRVCIFVVLLKDVGGTTNAEKRGEIRSVRGCGWVLSVRCAVLC